MDKKRADPDLVPQPSHLQAWVAAAQTGGGTPWLSHDQALLLARFAVDKGLGVSLMEASTPMFTEPPRDIGWEMLGADEAGENWSDHQDPARAYGRLRDKLRRAQREGAKLQYKLWLARPEG